MDFLNHPYFHCCGKRQRPMRLLLHNFKCTKRIEFITFWTFSKTKMFISWMSLEYLEGTLACVFPTTYNVCIVPL